MSVATIAGTARTLLRDFPQYFEVELGLLNTLTIRLPHPLVDGSLTKVYIGTPGAAPEDPWTSTLTTDWTMDERNGLLKFTDETLLNKRAVVSGYYYTWFLNSDLELHTKQAGLEFTYNNRFTIEDIEEDTVLSEVTALAAVVRALWSLAFEFSLDIDISTPEGMFIPARQRYQQVMTMMQYWETQLTTRTQALNIGLGALEQFTLRRRAKLTNRLVPIYREREIDDPRWPLRMYPPIPDQTIELANPDVDVIDVTEALTPDEIWRRERGVREIGWTSLGTSGIP